MLQQVLCITKIPNLIQKYYFNINKDTEIGLNKKGKMIFFYISKSRNDGNVSCIFVLLHVLIKENISFYSGKINN